MAAPKISVYSLPDLKNTSDDALPNFLKSIKFQQSHLLADVRLAIGYAAVAIAGATFYYDYYHSWTESKGLTFWAVGAYFILNSALTVWIWFVEKGVIFEGSRNGETISIASSVQKHSPIYRLEVQCGGSGSSGSQKTSNTHVEAPFTKWFTADGEFVASAFQSWLASEIPLIKKALTATKKSPGS